MEEESQIPATATIVMVSPDKSLQSAHSLVLEFIKTVEDGGELSEEQAVWSAGLMESVFESANHSSEDGTCECMHHMIAYRLRDISDQPYYKDFVITHEYLLDTMEMITELLASLHPSDIHKAE